MKKVKDLNLTDKANDVAKSIWLAGLGAYGKAFDEAVSQYDKVSKETSKLFDELVEKGRALDSTGQEKLAEAKSKTATSLEERLNKVKNSVNLSGLSVGVGNDVAALEEKIDVLAAKVDAILDSLGATVAPAASKRRAAKSAN